MSASAVQKPSHARPVLSKCKGAVTGGGAIGELPDKITHWACGLMSVFIRAMTCVHHTGLLVHLKPIFNWLRNRTKSQVKTHAFHWRCAARVTYYRSHHTECYVLPTNEVLTHIFSGCFVCTVRVGLNNTMVCEAHIIQKASHDAHSSRRGRLF